MVDRKVSRRLPSTCRKGWIAGADADYGIFVVTT
jgi:hypothetical protein